MKQGWIKCKERLPEYNELVIFGIASGVIYLGWLESEKDSENDDDMWRVVGIGARVAKEDVLCWFEIPPYQPIVTGSHKSETRNTHEPEWIVEKHEMLGIK